MPETTVDIQSTPVVSSVVLTDVTRDSTETETYGDNRDTTKIETDGDNRDTNMHPCQQLLLVWKTLFIILTPIILLIIPIFWSDEAGKCTYVIAIMAIYWMTEAIPMAVTALIPFALMPWLGILEAPEIAGNYLTDKNFLLVGGLFVALAIEKCFLHKRIALRILLLVGTKPKWLLLGFIIATGFLSMWLNNTATTAMMVPIAQAVLMELKDDIMELPGRTEPVDVERQTVATLQFDERHEAVVFQNDPDGKKAKRFSNLCKGFTLGICYAANIGGTCALTGTVPNLVLPGQLDTLFGPNHDINFASWMAFALPMGIICLFLSWLWLSVLFIGPKFRFIFYGTYAYLH